MTQALTYENYAAVKAKKPVRWWHEAVADDMLAFPMDSNTARAKRLGYNSAYLSVITNSDMFRAYFAKRRAEYQLRLDTTLIHKTAKCADKALDILLEQLETKRGSIPFDKLANFADQSLSRLGYGNNNTGGVSVTVDARSVTTITKEQLSEARGMVRAVEASRGAVTLASREGVAIATSAESEGSSET